VLVSETLAHNNYTAFLNLLNEANLTSIVDNLHRITLFVPTNSALAAVSTATSTPAQIQTLVYSHIVPNFLGYLPSLYNGLTLTTLANTTLTVTVTDGEYFVNGAHIVDPDVLTDNGVIDLIDKVSDSEIQSFSDANSPAGPYPCPVHRRRGFFSKACCISDSRNHCSCVLFALRIYIHVDVRGGELSRAGD
jgi:hypothetical protein